MDRVSGGGLKGVLNAEQPIVWWPHYPVCEKFVFRGVSTCLNKPQLYWLLW